MPILRKESELFPENLFSLDPAAAPWIVFHVRSRQEKRLARFLGQHGLPFYLPQVEHSVRRSGRTFVSFLPLFPGYVFSRRAKGWESAWQSDVIVAVIEVPDQERIALELGQIRALQEAGAVLSPTPVSLSPGDAVRITDGAFRDYVGVVLREKGLARLVVSVSILRKAVAVEFPREVLAPAKRVLPRGPRGR